MNIRRSGRGGSHPAYVFYSTSETCGVDMSRTRMGWQYGHRRSNVAFFFKDETEECLPYAILQIRYGTGLDGYRLCNTFWKKVEISSSE
jgi:hypothetical protein